MKTSVLGMPVLKYLFDVSMKCQVGRNNNVVSWKPIQKVYQGQWT